MALKHNRILYVLVYVTVVDMKWNVDMVLYCKWKKEANWLQYLRSQLSPGSVSPCLIKECLKPAGTHLGVSGWPEKGEKRLFNNLWNELKSSADNRLKLGNTARFQSHPHFTGLWLFQFCISSIDVGVFLCCSPMWSWQTRGLLQNRVHSAKDFNGECGRRSHYLSHAKQALYPLS